MAATADSVLKPDFKTSRKHFIFTDEHEQLRESITNFALKELAPHAEEWEETTFPDWVFRRMGELGFLSPNNRRTATVECIEDGQVLTITYERLLEIYFQNPQFGYYFLVLTSQRLLENNQRLEENISRLEAALAQEKAARQTAAAHGIA